MSAGETSGHTDVLLRFPVSSPKLITFNRRELGLILSLYGRCVAEGEWRDYALDFGSESATTLGQISQVRDA